MNKIIHGDSLEELKKLPEKSINMCMTSPPYWALRDYGVDGQLGLESTFDEYINKLCDIFDEVKRVLRDDGTCWVNMGDTYSTISGNMRGKEFNHPKYQAAESVTHFKQPKTKLPDKCLIMIPQRFAIEMVNRGWILRNTIIWHKPNCMPSSIKDRFTVDFEYLFFFSKKKKYYFETQYEEFKGKDERKWAGSYEKQGSIIQGDTNAGIKRTKRYPYAVQLRDKDFVEYRNLPDLKEFAKYINDKRKELEVTIDEVEEQFGNQAPHHWFNAESFPSVEDFLAKHSVLLENGKDFKTLEAPCFLRLQEYLKLKDLNLFSLKMSKGYSITKKGKLLERSFTRWQNWGMKFNGWYLTANFLEFPRTERGYSLSEVLEENPDQKYYLSEKATKNLLEKQTSKGARIHSVNEAREVTTEEVITSEMAEDSKGQENQVSL